MTSFKLSKNLRSFLIASVLLSNPWLVSQANAHFQLLFTEEMALQRGQATDMLMLFTHPVHGGPHMDMGKPRNFYVVSQRGDEAESVRTDLMEYLTPIAWQSAQGETAAWRAQMPRSVTRSIGDYIFVLEPEPYYEAEEDKYIQQFTRTMLNIAGVPGNWAEPMGLPAEIQPLNKPYANWVGGVFRGVVLANGEAVPHAEIEIEYLNHHIDRAKLSFNDVHRVELPQDSYGTMTIYADSAGEFTIGLPKAGWWGICALQVGATTEFDGKPLSQDAVLWIQAKDM